MCVYIFLCILTLAFAPTQLAFASKISGETGAAKEMTASPHRYLAGEEEEVLAVLGPLPSSGSTLRSIPHKVTCLFPQSIDF